MTTKYLLPCSCGEKHVVDNRQAGQSVQCACGNRLEVPTMRGLAGLAQVDADPAAKTKRVWGPRQGIFFIGLVIAAAAFGYCAYLYLFGPSLNLEKLRAEILNASAAQSWAWWQYLSKWQPGMQSHDDRKNEIAIIQNLVAMKVSLGVGVCGLLIAAGGFLVRPGRR